MAGRSPCSRRVPLTAPTRRTAAAPARPADLECWVSLRQVRPLRKSALNERPSSVEVWLLDLVDSNHDRIAGSCAADLLHAEPLTLPPTGTAAHALDLARSHRVTTIFLVEPGNGVAVGLIDLQDLLRVSID